MKSFLLNLFFYGFGNFVKRGNIRSVELEGIEDIKKLKFFILSRFIYV